MEVQNSMITVSQFPVLIPKPNRKTKRTFNVMKNKFKKLNADTIYKYVKEDKMLIIFIIVVMCILGLLGIAASYATGLLVDSHSKKDYLIEYINNINNKYTDDVFSFNSIYTENKDDFFTIIADSKNYPNSKVYIYDKEGQITDNYLDIKYNQNSHTYVNNIISLMVSDKLKEYSYSITTSVKNEDITENLSFIDYITNDNTLIGFKIVFTSDNELNKDYIEKTLNNTFVNQNINICGQFVFDVNCIEENVLSYGISDNEVILCKWKY